MLCGCSIYVPDRIDFERIYCWGNLRTIPGYDPNEWRIDAYGWFVRWSDYGDRSSAFGWEVDHFVARSLGGSDHISNKRGLHWQNNVQLGQQQKTVKNAWKGGLGGLGGYPSEKEGQGGGSGSVGGGNVTVPELESGNGFGRWLNAALPLEVPDLPVSGNFGRLLAGAAPVVPEPTRRGLAPDLPEAPKPTTGGLMRGKW